MQRTIFYYHNLVLDKLIRVICPDEGLMLKISASLYFYGDNLTLVNLFDNKFSCFTSSWTQHHGLF